MDWVKKQKTQNEAMRRILNAGKRTSIGAMERLLMLEPMAARNDILMLQFFGRLHNNNDKRIPAVTIYRYRRQQQAIPSGSLIRSFEKHRFNNFIHQAGFLFNPLTNDPSMVDYSRFKPIAKDKKDAIVIYWMEKLHQ